MNLQKRYAELGEHYMPWMGLKLAGPAMVIGILGSAVGAPPNVLLGIVFAVCGMFMAVNIVARGAALGHSLRRAFLTMILFVAIVDTIVMTLLIPA